MFHKIATKLLNPNYRLQRGGEPIRIVRTALQRLEKKYGALSPQRIVDYVVCSAHALKNHPLNWNLNGTFGPKSIERFNTDRGRVYYENRWLNTVNLTRAELLEFVMDKSIHPKAKFIHIPSEEGTKARLLNKDVGFAICQTSTLGWSPISETCAKCRFINKCKQETQKKYPEIYRLRIEYGSKE